MLFRVPPSSLLLPSPLPRLSIFLLLLLLHPLFLAPSASALAGSPLLSHPPGPSEEKSLLRRQAGTRISTPAPIEVAPSQYWDGIDGPWSSFPIQIGNHAQTIRVLPGTASSTTITVSAYGCPPMYGPGCAGHRGGLFLPNESLTWVPNSVYNLNLEKNLGLDTTAITGYDTITLGWPGTQAPSIEHTVVQNLAVQDFWLGIFGLRVDPTNFTNMGDPQPSYMTMLAENNKIPSLSFAYTAGNRYRLNGVYGSLVLGGYDRNRFDSARNISMTMYADTDRRFLVFLQKITTGADSSTDLLPDGTISILIDSTVSHLWLPESACKAFELAFGLVWDDTFGFYLLNNSRHETLSVQNPTVTFTIGSLESGGPVVDIAFPYGAFDLNVSFPYIVEPNNSFYFPLKRANSSQYTLGRAFLQEAYLIADYDNMNFTVAPCTWDENLLASSNIVPIVRASTIGSGSGDNGAGADGKSSSGTSVTTIVGAAVGGIAAAALVIGAILFLARRRKRADTSRSPESEGTSSSKEQDEPFARSPARGELDSTGVLHELIAAHKLPPERKGVIGSEPSRHGYSEMESPHRTNPNRPEFSEMEGSSEYFPSRSTKAAEIDNTKPIYEVAGSDVNEMAATDKAAGGG